MLTFSGQPTSLLVHSVDNHSVFASGDGSGMPSVIVASLSWSSSSAAGGSWSLVRPFQLGGTGVFKHSLDFYLGVLSLKTVHTTLYKPPYLGWQRLHITQATRSACCSTRRLYPNASPRTIRPETKKTETTHNMTIIRPCEETTSNHPCLCGSQKGKPTLAGDKSAAAHATLEFQRPTPLACAYKVRRPEMRPQSHTQQYTILVNITKISW